MILRWMETNFHHKEGIQWSKLSENGTALGCSSLPLEELIQKLGNHKARRHSGDSSMDGQTLTIIQSNSAISDKHDPEVLTFLRHKAFNNFEPCVNKQYSSSLQTTQKLHSSTNLCPAEMQGEPFPIGSFKDKCIFFVVLIGHLLIPLPHMQF